MRVLLVEDEKKLTQALLHISKKEKINMDVANDGEEGLFLAKIGVYDVIVLDIMLPKLDGLEILKTIRSEGSSVPIMLLTARDGINDRVKGLTIGADDYLVKPFATQELFARIRALYRRINTNYLENKLTLKNVEYNLDTKQLIINNEEIVIADKEAQLMEMFMRRPNQVFTREQILDKIWGYDSIVTENNIEIYIHHLRKKMKGKTDIVIKTIRGVGYSLKEK